MDHWNASRAAQGRSEALRPIWNFMQSPKYIQSRLILIHEAQAKGSKKLPCKFKAIWCYQGLFKEACTHPKQLKRTWIHPGQPRKAGIHPGQPRKAGIHPGQPREAGMHAGQPREAKFHPVKGILKSLKSTQRCPISSRSTQGRLN